MNEDHQQDELHPHAKYLDLGNFCTCFQIFVQHDCARMDRSKISIMVIDSDAEAARRIRRTLAGEGYKVVDVSHESEALDLAAGELFNIVVKSFDARHINAVALMEKLRGISPDTQFIFISEKGTIYTAVDAMRKGAFDYLAKPIDSAQLIESVAKALDYQSLVAEDQQIKQRLRRRSEPDIFAGKSSVVRDISALIRQVAPTEVTVLLEGESGSGKEVAARAIHEQSRRRSKPFIAVNCAALPDSLIEAELFGHIRGAFTGAVKDRKGRFQLAQGGTLFLDEIGDLSRKGQGDLLRVLEDNLFRPVGSDVMVRADVRLIAATNKNLERESSEGGFREDLYYRLNIVSVRLPPLRERAGDIEPLLQSFAEHFCAKHRRRPKKFHAEVIACFRTFHWPGNVRQLRNLVERLVVTIPQTTITAADLPPDFRRGRDGRESLLTIQAGMTLAQVEEELIRQTLLKVTSNREEAAKRLGISRRTLQYKLREYGLTELSKAMR